MFIKLILTFLYSISVFSDSRNAELPVYEAAGYCSYSLQNDARTDLLQMQQKDESVWKKFQYPMLYLGNTQDILWLRCRIKGLGPGTEWVAVSQLSFSRRVTFFVSGSNGIFSVSESGTSVPMEKKTFPHRLDLSRFSLDQNGSAEIYIRYESILTKSVLLQFMTSAQLAEQDRFEQVFFQSFTAVLAVINVLNFVLFLAMRNPLPLLYNLLIISYYLYQAVQFGYGPVFIYPGHPEFNPNMVSITAGVTIIFFQLFFKKLLNVAVYLPFLNRVINIMVGVTASYILLSLSGIVSLSKLQIYGRLLFFSASILNVYAGIRIYRMGYRPVIFSIYGFMILIFCQGLYFSFNLNIIPYGGLGAKFLLPVGQAVEFVFFFVTLSMRVREPHNALIEKSKKAKPTENKKMRIRESKLEDADSRLKELFEKEKIFCDEDLSLDRLSDMMNLSRQDLSDLLNRKYGKNFYQFVNQFRVEEVKSLLISDKNRSILSIAFSSGFNSKSTFNKEFKRLTGMTPKEFRNQNRNNK